MRSIRLKCPECKKPVRYDFGSSYGYCPYCLVKFGLEIDSDTSVKMEVSDLADHRRHRANTAFHNRQYEKAYDYYKKALELDSFHPFLTLYKGLSAALGFQAYDETISDFQKAQAILIEFECPTALLEVVDIYTDLFMEVASQAFDAHILLYGLQAEAVIDKRFPDHKHDLVLTVFNRCRELYDLSQGKWSKEEFVHIMRILKYCMSLLQAMDQTPRKLFP